MAKIYEYTIEIDVNGSRTTSKSVREQTPEEIQATEKAKDVQATHDAYTRSHTESINCDECGGYICEAYANDLNGSRFYHPNCK